MHAGHGQPVAAVPARGRLLAHVGPTHIDAETFDVARRAVRHVAPAPHQNCRAHRRNEDDDPRSLADIVSRARYFALRPRAHPAPRHVTDGAQRPKNRTLPVNPKTFSTPNTGVSPATTG